MKLISRDEYYKLNKGVADRKCPFCFKEQVVLHEGVKWDWIAANAPYMKYQTMLVPKRHIVRMSEVDSDEWAEFSQLLEKITNLYDSADIQWGDTGEDVENIFFGWRYRGKEFNEVLNTRNLDHLHLHIFPDREHYLDPITQPDGHHWDYKLFQGKLK